MNYLIRAGQIFFALFIAMIIMAIVMTGVGYVGHVVGDYVFEITDSPTEASLCVVSSMTTLIIGLVAIVAAAIVD